CSGNISLSRIIVGPYRTHGLILVTLMLIFEYTPDSEMRVKIFDSYDEEWLEFVCKSRKGDKAYNEYDIIEGGVANDKVFQTVDLYMAGIYNKEQALQNLAYEKPNHQLCFITQRAIDKCLKFVEHKKV
ncbi:MAG: DUF3990 domain-containing protein, partial [Muribaculaceae bacterium]|nr:DUF3990 domain-containing protein [Muribaculaceae bacterium]